MQVIHEVTPLSLWEEMLDFLWIPSMYLASGTVCEVPQQTHPWNRRSLSYEERLSLNPDLNHHEPGDNEAASPWLLGFIPRFHLPIIGGWRNYVVIKPVQQNMSHWYVGWVNAGACGVSRLPLTGPVRLLIGPENTDFIGLDEDGFQIKVKKTGKGRIGTGGRYAHLPLR